MHTDVKDSNKNHSDEPQGAEFLIYGKIAFRGKSPNMKKPVCFTNLIVD